MSLFVAFYRLLCPCNCVTLYYQVSVVGIAQKLLGETCYVGWPHMVEALVMGVCDGSKRYVLPSIKELKGLCKWTVDFFSKMANKQI